MRRFYVALAAALGGPTGLGLRRDLVPHLLDRAPDEARDVHLGDADLLCDLGLGQALEEPQVEDAPLALVEGGEAGCEHRTILADLVFVLQRAE